MQFLSVERRSLTIVLMYGIITAEKEFLRSRIFDFLIAPIFHRNGLDHSFDHLPIRTTWKQCERDHRKASFSDTKAPKSPRNQEENRYIFLRVLETVGSSPAASTKKEGLPLRESFFFAPSRCTDLDTVALATWVRILRAERFKLACKRQA